MTVGTLDTRIQPGPRWLALLSQAWCELVGAVSEADTAPAATPPRYRHPHTGQAWDGHGHQPQWLRDALLCEGFTVDELRRAARAGASAAH